MSAIADDVVITLDGIRVNSLRKRVAEAQWKSWRTRPTIVRVPKGMRELDSNAYQPRIISLGPYHHREPHLQAMNKLKWYYLQKFLARQHAKSLEYYLKEMKAMEKPARSAYSEDIKMDSNEFIQMMLLDCCFVVEILLRQTLDRKLHKQDPILSAPHTERLVDLDMMRLENQLPLFPIQSLINSIFPGQTCFLQRLTLLTYKHYLPRNQAMPSSRMDHHLLHLFHSSFIPQKNQNNRDNGPSFLCHNISPNVSWLINKLRFRSSSMLHQQPSTTESIPCPRELEDEGAKLKRMEEAAQQPSMPASIPCARELEYAGIRLKRKEKAASFLDITFHKGTMEIPRLAIYDDTNYLLRNLIAFEQCYPDASTHVAAYASLMNFIIDTPEDVALLRRHGIIDDCLGNSDEIASFFNTLCKEVEINFEGSYLEDVVRDVHKYCNIEFHKWRAILMHNYFSNPWKNLSFAVSIFALIFTIQQTFITVLGFAFEGQ